MIMSNPCGYSFSKVETPPQNGWWKLPTSTATLRSPAEEVDLPDPGAEEEVWLVSSHDMGETAGLKS